MQPFSSKPFTTIEPDSSFSATTHLGTDYAALLVDPEYAVVKKTDVLPAVGGPVKAIATVPGRPSSKAPAIVAKSVQFSGYTWEVLQVPTESAGVMHANSASNVWTDSEGFLHLRIARQQDQWTCAEVTLSRSLGYGEYKFTLRQLPPMEPGTVLGLFTHDPMEAAQDHREIDIELSQWGDPAAKNSQFAIQPYYLPANMFRFDSPNAALTHSFRWQRAHISFKSHRANNELIAEHVFTSGVPTPGGERVHLNLYTFGKSPMPQQNGIEVIIEKFEYRP